MSDWGKGAENNTIGWGQGVATNSVGWGSIYGRSFSGDTVIDPSVAVLIANYKTRIQNDNGTFENEECLKQYLNLIQ